VSSAVASADLESNWCGAAHVDCDLGDTVTAVDVSKDSQYFAASSMNKNITVFSAMTGVAIANFKTESPANAIKFTFHGAGWRTILVAGTFGGLLRVYDVGTEKELCKEKFAANGSEVRDMSLCDVRKGMSGAAAQLAVCGKAPEVILYVLIDPRQSLRSGAEEDETSSVTIMELMRFKSSGPMNGVAFSSSGRVLAAGGDSRPNTYEHLGKGRR